MAAQGLHAAELPAAKVPAAQATQGLPAAEEVPGAHLAHATAAPPAEVVPATQAAQVPFTRKKFGAHMGSGLAAGEGVADGRGANGSGAGARPRNSVLAAACATSVTAQPVLQVADAE